MTLQLDFATLVGRFSRCRPAHSPIFTFASPQHSRFCSSFLLLPNFLTNWKTEQRKIGYFVPSFSHLLVFSASRLRPIEFLVPSFSSLPCLYSLRGSLSSRLLVSSFLMSSSPRSLSPLVLLVSLSLFSPWLLVLGVELWELSEPTITLSGGFFPRFFHISYLYQ